jgi:dinuclear metal center YbgI/SA1388 family protein
LIVKLDKIVRRLDKELAVEDFEDSSHNGLQVQNSGRVRRVCCGVDATLPFFEAAAGRGADLLICHHGLSWGDSLKRITELNYNRIKFLIEHDMALYACHLPLDAHPRLGNNILICKALKLQQIEPFGRYHGKLIGFAGKLPKAVRYETFKKRVATLTGRTPRSMDFGKRTVRSVAVISGGAANEIVEAGRKRIDVYLSGEANLNAYHMAREYGVNAVFAGHYATEVFGVRELGRYVKQAFKLPAEFIDTEVPF